MEPRPVGSYDGINPLKNHQFMTSSAEADGLLDEVLVEIVPGTKYRKRDIAMVVVCSVSAIALCFLIVRTLYRCCCSRNYATWRTKWSVAIKSRLKGRNRKKSFVYNIVDAVPVKFNAHDEDIEHISATTDSPLVASHDMQGEILILDVLSGECHTRIKRSNSIVMPDPRVHQLVSTHANLVPRTSLQLTNLSHDLSLKFQPGHKLSDSISSDSTNRSSPSTGSIDCPFEVQSQQLQPSPSTVVINRQPVSKLSVATCARSSNHRRHHSMGSIPAQARALSQLPATGSPLPPQSESRVDPSSASNSTSRPQNASREVLSDIMRSAYYSSSTSNLSAMNVTSANTISDSPLNPRAIWSMEMFGQHLFLGCEKGRIEVWHCMTGQLSYFNDEKSKSGITVIKANNTQLVVGYLDGNMEIYQKEPRNGKHFFQKMKANQSPGSDTCDNSLNYNLHHSVTAHRQPITALQMDGFHIVTGSLDHVVKVFAQETASCMYTFNGHFGGITCIVLEQTSSTAITGCQVGQVCLWDLQTGTCLFSIEAHPGSCVSAIIQTPLYFISSATDNNILIWDKYSGALVHSITQHHSVCKDMVLLAANVLVTAKEDYLILYDIREGKKIGIVNVSNSSTRGSSPPSTRLTSSSSSPHLVPSSPSSALLSQGKCYIKNLKVSSQNRAVVCDFGSQVCVIHLTEKYD